MKKIHVNRPIRFIAYLLGGLALAMTIVATFFVILLASHDAYNRKPISDEELYCKIGFNYAPLYPMARDYMRTYYAAAVYIPELKKADIPVDPTVEQEIQDKFDQMKQNQYESATVTASVTILDDERQVLFTNSQDQPAIFTKTYILTAGYVDLFSWFDEEFQYDQNMPAITEQDFVVQIDVLQLFDESDEQQVYRFNLISTLNQNRILLFILPFVSVIIFLASMVFLMRGAGHDKDRSKIYLNWLDRLPMEIMLILMTVATWGGIAIFSRFIMDYWQMYINDFNPFAAALIGAVLWLTAVIFMFFLSSLAARIKAGKWWRCSLTWHFIRLLAGISRHLPIIWKGLLVMIAFAIIDPSLILNLPWVWVFIRLGVIVTVCLLLVQLDRLKKAGCRLAEGRLEIQVDEKGLVGDFRVHAENLNSIRSVISQAVEERLKSELFKTELITNVSHDIRTPLTSIINYVDLLKKQPIENPTTREYIDVIDRQSERLKKLSEDIMDASKAATGDLDIKRQETNLNEMVAQISEEYADRFAANELTLVSKTPEEPSLVTTDSRLLWRILDNLFQNVSKYAMPGTRVYLDLDKKPEGIDILLRNISRDQLKTDGEILLERFIQGDPSRSSEGSGLGLYIAQNLASLINGRLSLVVDGDLFKVALHLPISFAKQTL